MRTRRRAPSSSSKRLDAKARFRVIKHPQAFNEHYGRDADVRCDYATDNVRFTGSRAGVIEAAMTFARRCRAAKAALNDIDVNLGDVELRKAVEQ